MGEYGIGILTGIIAGVLAATVASSTMNVVGMNACIQATGANSCEKEWRAAP